MKQENQTITDYHAMMHNHNTPVKKYHAIRLQDSLTSRYRWRVVSFGTDGEAFHRYPAAYGMRAAVRLANRLNKIWDKFKASV